MRRPLAAAVIPTDGAVAFAPARFGLAEVAGSATPSDPLRLEAVASNRNTAQNHVWRAAIMLLSADGTSTNEIMR